MELCSFAIIADIQHADVPDALNYMKTKMRFYRGALRKLKEAVEVFNAVTPAITFGLQLGDFLDGKAASKAEETLDALLAALNQARFKFHHTYGNHELYCFSRKRLLESALFGAHSEDHAVDGDCYYSFSPVKGLRVVMCDGYDIGLLGRDESDATYKKAQEYLRINKNSDLNDPNGLSGVQQRFVAFNGAIGPRQLSWLRAVLTKATEQNEIVVLSLHVPLYEKACDSLCLLWNYQEVLDLLHEFSCVVATFSGHDHDGGYAQDEHGIHHVVMKAVVEAPEDSNYFAIARVYNDRIDIQGYGIPDLSLVFAERK